MKNLETSSTKPYTKINKFYPIAILFFSFLGFADASYLAIKHFVGTPIPCSILRGCEEVTTSQYSTVAGIPVALLGAFYYLALFTLVFLYFSKNLYFDKTDRVNFEDGAKTLGIAARLTVIGLAASLWFVYLQLFVIKAICLYCMFSALTSLTLFALGVFVIKYYEIRKLPN